MPPKSTRKASSAKRSSLRSKTHTLAPPTPFPVPPVAEETADDPAAAVESKEEAPATAEEIAAATAAADAMEEASAEEDADDKLVDEKIAEGIVAEKVVEETTVEKIEEEMTAVEEAAFEKVLDSSEAADVDEKIMEGIVVEKVVEETTVEKIEEETTVMEEAAVEKVLDSSEAAPMEAANNGEDKGADDKEDATEAEVKEAKDKEPEEEGEEEEDDPEEEEEESDKEEEFEFITGNKQIVQEEIGEGEIESISEDDEENEEHDPAMYMQTPLLERKKQKDFEIFIGGLDKGAVDEDLIKVFGVFGEIQSVRIAKHPVTQKSKGFAFVRYANIEHTKKALAELKDGAEVKGKKIRVSASQDNDTLYLGNICKTWTKDNVLETLKGYGVEHIEDILLPDDPKNEGKIRGFAFLEFKSHSDAMAAFQHLRKPDAVFGRNISAKVAFAQAPLHPCEEDLLKVKTVYMEGIPKSWDESKVEELCKQYGEILKIQLAKNFTSRKKKDFGFVEFFSRDGAVACVEGINNTQLEEDVNVKANLAKPMYKGRLAKQSRGGYKIQKNVEATEEPGKSKKKKKAKSKAVHDKNETQPNLKSSNKNIPSKSQDKNLKEKKASQTVQSAKGQKRGRKGTDIAVNQQPPKKARNTRNYGRGRGRHSTGFSNPRSSYSSNPYVPRPTTYAPPATSYTAHAYPGASGSQHRRTDLEPHAGYLPAANQVRHPYGYDGRSRSGAYGFQPRTSSGDVGAPNVQSSCPGYSSYAGYEASYTYPNSGARAYRRPYY